MLFFEACFLLNLTTKFSAGKRLLILFFPYQVCVQLYLIIVGTITRGNILQHRGKTSAHAEALKMVENLNPTFVNKNMAFQN